MSTNAGHYGQRDVLTKACFLVALAFLSVNAQTWASGGAVFNVRDYGAVADGETLDTEALNAAIAECAEAGGGQVRVPPGTYLSGTVHMRSKVTLKLDAGARIVGTEDLEQYDHYAPPEGTPEAGKHRWHRALILADGVKNVAITGNGTIDGNKVYDAKGEEGMRGPHTIIVGSSREVVIRDITVKDSANYAMLVEYSDRVEVRDVKATGGWDAVHFRGWVDRPCHDIRIIGCRFFTGDDCIAGRYVKDLLISDCVINTSCNGIRIIGPITHMIVHDCLFYGPGVHPHRSQDRHNMLAGIILQPGAWDKSPGALEDVLISDVTMKNTAAPVTIYLKRPGNTAENITVDNLSATGVYRAAASVESWTDTPVGRVVFRDVSIEYEGGGTRKQAEKPARKPGVGARPLPAWGFYARNASEVHLEDVTFTCRENDLRPVMKCRNLERLGLTNLFFPEFSEIEQSVILQDVGKITRLKSATADQFN